MELTKNLIPNFALWDTSLKQNESQTNDSQNAEAGWVMEADLQVWPVALVALVKLNTLAHLGKYTREISQSLLISVSAFTP